MTDVSLAARKLRNCIFMICNMITLHRIVMLYIEMLHAFRHSFCEVLCSLISTEKYSISLLFEAVSLDM